MAGFNHDFALHSLLTALLNDGACVLVSAAVASVPSQSRLSGVLTLTTVEGVFDATGTTLGFTSALASEAFASLSDGVLALDVPTPLLPERFRNPCTLTGSRETGCGTAMLPVATLSYTRCSAHSRMGADAESTTPSSFPSAVPA